jgi:hypothetical protein
MSQFNRARMLGFYTLGSVLILTTVTCMPHAGQTYWQQPPLSQQPQQQQYQQRNQPSFKYFSDLAQSASTIELPIPAYKSLSYGLAGAQENQLSDKHAPHPVLKNGPRAVINGNHATYVEPPANFKPIIYEHLQESSIRDTNQVSSQKKQQANVNDSPATQNGDTIVESPNHLVASMLAPLSGSDSPRQQQHQERQTLAMSGQRQTNQQAFGDQRTSSTGQQDNDTSANAESDAEDEQNSLPLKPSIDRWSDWHDMSVDPDLASSETQAQSAGTSFYMAQPPQQHYHHNQQHQQHQQQLGHSGGRNLIQAKASQEQSRDRVHNPNSNAIKIMHPAKEDQAPAQGLQALPSINQLYEQQQQQQKMLAANLIKMQQPFGASAELKEELKQDYIHQAQAHNRYHPSNQQPQHYMNVAFHEHHHLYQRPSPQPQTPPHAQQALYYIQQQQQQQQQQLLPSSSQTARSSFAPVSSPAMLMMIQRQQPQAIMDSPLLASDRRMSNSLDSTNNNEHSQHDQLAPLNRVRNVKSHNLNAEVKLAANQRKLQGYQLSAPLVLSPQAHESVAGSKPQLSKPVSGQPAVATSRVLITQPHEANSVAERLSRPATTSTTTTAAATASAANSASPSHANTLPKRVLKRSRIKTLLPVGLSSWFLGGIRDLDARHWKLPSELMNKLVINDVDLQHSEPAPRQTMIQPR